VWFWTDLVNYLKIFYKPKKLTYLKYRGTSA
jgi:hypothetical protein